MPKKTIQIIKAAICFIVVMLAGSSVYAETTQVQVEIPCCCNFKSRNSFRFEGQSGVQLALTTEGIRVNGGEIEKVTLNSFGNARTVCDVQVYAQARCIPSNEWTEVSATSSSLVCENGEGMIIEMLEPNSANFDQYKYVGTVIISKDEESVELISGDVFIAARVVGGVLQPGGQNTGVFSLIETHSR